MSEELWVDIDDDPRYAVSDRGRVRRNETGKILRQQKNQQGTPFVMLYEGIRSRQRSRSINLLVAHIFVEGYDDVFNTPIHLNGDRSDCQADNLMWRPRWFAMEFHRQFQSQDLMNRFLQQMINDQTGQVYENVRDVVTRCGVLVTGVTDSIWNRNPVLPIGHTFSIL